MRIKVCGLTSNPNIREVSALKPDYMGFICCKSSPRDVSNSIDILNFDLLSEGTKKVAVFVNEDAEIIKRIVDKYSFDYVQLHGDESPEFCFQLKAIAGIVKAFRIGDQLPENLNEYKDCCDFFLFDSAGKHYGGNGFAFNHSVLDGYAGQTPFFLSGGIAPTDFGYLNSIINPLYHGVDINSQFETTPGIKDVTKIRNFINNLNK
ncbi:MAG: phosphoribosylanthranilate isomerase [Bacteroidales bacterium]|jgi:phosphoribosylanthranilate isomerase|nr:phosphoribosylanthranilate isomerase [Bacteroidales bacterium]MDD2264813.1 phosphoribosylanthranilate isomerase [Bacteroidales bacterium]MDD2832089.1 phosphoribosylanthranilate isomerase [Bacteroidales bacterium]MDD3208717.1 phosphoribosylanthranilate isomerase [Bacteroidales bacterium]MDD3697280.1 phosphoribosylanthranilate isomerase [Bacteroidales bacterium]